MMRRYRVGLPLNISPKAPAVRAKGIVLAVAKAANMLGHQGVAVDDIEWSSFPDGEIDVILILGGQK